MNPFVIVPSICTFTHLTISQSVSIFNGFIPLVIIMLLRIFLHLHVLLLLIIVLVSTLIEHYL